MLILRRALRRILGPNTPLREETLEKAREDKIHGRPQEERGEAEGEGGIEREEEREEEREGRRQG